MAAAREHILADLRDRIAGLQTSSSKNAGCLAFGVPEIDAVLPGGGLAHGSLHEFAGGGAARSTGQLPPFSWQGSWQGARAISSGA